MTGGGSESARRSRARSRCGCDSRRYRTRYRSPAAFRGNDRCRAVAADVADEASVRELFARIDERHEGLTSWSTMKASPRPVSRAEDMDVGGLGRDARHQRAGTICASSMRCRACENAVAARSSKSSLRAARLSDARCLLGQQVRRARAHRGVAQEFGIDNTPRECAVPGAVNGELMQRVIAGAIAGRAARARGHHQHHYTTRRRQAAGSRADESRRRPVPGREASAAIPASVFASTRRA